MKGFSEAIRKEAKQQSDGFLSMSLGTLGATLLGNLLTGKRVKVRISIQGVSTKNYQN